MSDQARGPDWWLASDGKWYPPTSLPQAPPPPPPPSPAGVGAQSGPPPHLSGALAGWVQGLMWVTGSFWAVATLAQVLTIQRFNAWWDAPLGRDNAEWEAWGAAEDLLGAANLASFVVWIAAFIVLVVWMNQAHKVTSWLNPQPRSWSSGWTVGGWFVPFANFVIPKLVFHEIERLALAVRDPGAGGRDWRKLPTMKIGWLWWLASIAALVAAIISGAILDQQFEALVLDPGSVRAGYGWGAVANALLAASAVAAGLYVRALTRRIAGVDA